MAGVSAKSSADVGKETFEVEARRVAAGIDWELWYLDCVPAWAPVYPAQDRDPGHCQRACEGVEKETPLMVAHFSCTRRRQPSPCPEGPNPTARPQGERGSGGAGINSTGRASRARAAAQAYGRG
jgi:hypothetical protein